MATLLERAAQDVVDVEKLPARLGKHLVRLGNLCHVRGPVDWAKLEAKQSAVHSAMVALYRAVRAQEEAIKEEEART